MMICYARKQQKRSDSECSDSSPADRISSLPESIIAYILDFLPTKYAVRTSCLSKSWRRRWTKVTTFDFDDRSGPKICSGGWDMNFAWFVNMVLINHTAESINKFRLRWYRKVQGVYLNTWINSAIARNVQVLDLDISSTHTYDENYHMILLPEAVYTCRTLEVLKLKGPFRVHVSHAVCLPKLAVLELIKVKYNNFGPVKDSVTRLISGCPVLQSLKIQRDCMEGLYDDQIGVYRIVSPVLKRLQFDFVGDPKGIVRYGLDRRLEIDAPALEYLVLHDNASRVITIQGQTSPVNEVDLDICQSGKEDDLAHQNMIVEIVQRFNGATVLKLSVNTFYALCKSSYKLSRSFERLTKLVVEFFDCQWRFLMDLIDGCSELQVLDITKVGDSDKSILGTCWRDPIRVLKCLLSSLRRFSFGGLDGIGCEIFMLKYIIGHGLVMERVHLSCDSTVRLKAKFGILNEVSMLSRASPACKISCSR